MEKKNPKEIVFYYEKTPQYRTVNADGAYGGMTPTNQVNLSFYSTRNYIPKSVTHQVYEDGTLSKNPIEEHPESKKGIIREVEFGVYMNKQSAHDLYLFLKTIFENEPK